MPDGTATTSPAASATTSAPVPTPPKDTAPATGTQPENGAKDGDEQLGPNGLKALQAERKRADEFERRLNALKPLEQIAAALGDGDAKKGKTEIEHLADRVAQHEKDLVDERQARWRAELANEFGLTVNQARRLIGTTRDEMKADAAELVKDFEVAKTANTGNGRPKPDRSQGGGASAGVTSGKEQGLAMARKRFGAPAANTKT